MRRPRLVPFVTGASFALALAGAVSTVVGDGEAPAHVAEIRDVMLTVNAGEGSLVELLRAQVSSPNPPDEDGWAVAKARAAMVVEAAGLLHGMKPPKGADDAAGLAKWKERVMAYRGCADAAREGAAKKDVAATKAALASLAKQCNACHKDHRADE